VVTRTRHNIALFVHSLSCSTLDSEWVDLLPAKELPIRIRQGWRTYGMVAQNGTRNDFLGTRHSLLSHFFLISFVRPASVYREHVNMYRYLTAYELYMYYRFCQIKLPVKHFYTNQERCDVLTGNLSVGRRSGGDWANI